MFNFICVDCHDRAYRMWAGDWYCRKHFRIYSCIPLNTAEQIDENDAVYLDEGEND
jgi:hypothetical protein